MSQITTSVETAVTRLRLGDAVAIPTETVYGLAACASNSSAIDKIFALKGRPTSHPLILHVSEGFDIKRLVSFVSDDAKALMQAFWPGPLTLVFHKRANEVLDKVTGGQSTVAIRCPAHPIAQEVLTLLGEPLVAPSANSFGKISPTTAQHVEESFAKTPLLILDGGRCQLGIESTIVSVLDKDGYQLLRPGAINEEQISAVVQSHSHNTTSVRVSGGLKQHYQPHKPLYCFESFNELLNAYQKLSRPAYVLSFESSNLFLTSCFYLLPQDAVKVAYELYYQLHQADESEVGCIFVQLPPNEKRWTAVRDRIIKASTK